MKQKKGWTKQSTRRKSAVVANPKQTGTFEQEICVTRTRSRNSGQFVKVPKAKPEPARPVAGRTVLTDMRAPAMNNRGQIIQRQYQTVDGERVLSKVTVQDTKARKLEASGAITTKARLKAEKDTAAEVLARERGGRFWEEWEAEQQRAGYNSDKGKRGAVSRVRNAAGREMKNKRTRDTKRQSLMRQMQSVERLQNAVNKARIPATRDRYAAQLPAARARLAKTRAEFKKAGGDLAEVTPTKTSRKAV